MYKTHVDSHLKFNTLEVRVNKYETGIWHAVFFFIYLKGFEEVGA